MGIAAEAAPWSGRTVLVTGAAGLLGSRVATLLSASGARVLGLDIAWDGPRAAFVPHETQRVRGDIRDTALLRQLLSDVRADTVLHLAAQTLVGPAVDDPADTFSNNIEGSWSVLEACRASASVDSVIVASSDKAYGDRAGTTLREPMALRALHPYDVSKAATDMLAQCYAATYGLPVAVTRCANLYGGGDLNWSRVVPGTIRSVLEHRSPVVRSDGTPVRDYLHVSDAAAGVLLLAQAVRRRPDLRGTAFNFSAGFRLKVLDVVARILRLMESSLEPRVLGSTTHEIHDQRVSAARARRVLGWRSRMTFDAGLGEAISWYRRYLSTVG